MTDRPEDIQRRLQGLDEIGQVVGALRAIASGHVASSRHAVEAIGAHSRTVEAALERLAFKASPKLPKGAGLVLVVGAAQGFSGAYPLHLASAAQKALKTGAGLLVVGQRTLSMLGPAGEAALWSGDLPGHTREVPAQASEITDRLIELAEHHPGPIYLVSGKDQPGQPVETRRLWPPEPRENGNGAPRPPQDPPMINLPLPALLEAVLHEALFAVVTLALMEGLRAENQARVEAMTRAQTNLRYKREEIGQDYKRARQDQMTDEMIELTMGHDSA